MAAQGSADNGKGKRERARRISAEVRRIEGLSDLERAFLLASRLHADQKRKGSDVPYLSHPLAVASLVYEDGGTIGEVIAALLHDAVEDQGGQAALDEIKTMFGHDVARIVGGCSDSDQEPKPEWGLRKEAYLDHLREASDNILRISLADKLHNARCILRDLNSGEDVFSRFNAGRDAQIHYYRSLVELFQRRKPGVMADELERTVSRFSKLAPPGTAPPCPRCGRQTTKPIVYGLPGDDMASAAKREEIELGGCVVDDEQPEWSCSSCRFEWGESARG